MVNSPPAFGTLTTPWRLDLGDHDNPRQSPHLQTSRLNAQSGFRTLAAGWSGWLQPP